MTITIQPILPNDSWIDIKAALLAGDDLLVTKDGRPNKSKKIATEMVLDNTNEALFGEKMILSVLRRMMANLIAFDIVGVQAIKSPMGQIYTLRAMFEDGNDLLKIQILKEVVQARFHEYSTSWRQTDINDDIVNILASKLTDELDQQLIQTLHETAGDVSSTFDCKNLTIEPMFVGDQCASMAIHINRRANLIMLKTRRGSGNWCMVSPLGLTILKAATTTAFSGVPVLSAGIQYAGTLNNSVRVYVNPQASNAEPVLVGYNGSTDMDSPIIVCPYLPLLIDGLGDSIVKYKSMNAQLILPKTRSQIGNAADYLGRVGIENIEHLSFV